MFMEEEVIIYLRAGFLVVMLPVMAVVLFLMLKFKRMGYGWFLLHLVLFSIGALWWIRLLETRAFTSSVYNSLMIAMIGMLWLISMIFFVKGLLSLRNKGARV